MHVKEEDVTHVHINMQGVEVVVKPMPKVNPFGDAKPREVLLHDKGLDWKKIDLELERHYVERYFHPHFRYYMREIRIVVYSQFLESYKSITIDFIDIALSRFVTAGKLHYKIDKVVGVLEINRPDAKNVLYQSTIK